jgi:hypothetical protein
LNTNRRNRRFKERRGVGAIIGGVILVAILLTTVMLYFMTVLNNEQRRASYDIASAQDNQDKASERLLALVKDRVIDPFGKPGGIYMNTLMLNDGPLTLVIAYSVLHCIDCAAPNNPTDDDSAITLNSKEEDSRLFGPLTIGKTYRVDFITERGNIVTTQDCLVGDTELVCSDGPGSGSPDFVLSSSPSTIFIDPVNSDMSTITVTSLGSFSFEVSLNHSGAPDGMTLSLTPDAVTPLAGDSGESTLLIDVQDTVASGTYVVTVKGTSGILTHTTDVTIIIFSIDGGDADPIPDDSILKPQIQGIFPNPHGSLASSSVKQGLWGVVVANPSDATMNVRRVVITAFNPYGTNPAIFPNACPVTNVQPSGGGSWSCPSQNTLIWSGTLTIPAHSAQSFLATAGKPASNDDFPSYSINFNVFTTFGQYAKAGYSGSMTKSASEIANVYLSTTSGSTATTSMIGTTTISSGGSLNFYATIANLGDTGGLIKAGTKLIVTTPKAFTAVNVSPNPPSAGFNSCTVINLGDGSTQITCPLASDLTAGQARSVAVTMTAPTNNDPTSKLYPLLVLADGTDGRPAPMGAVGPVSENVIIVLPAP